MKLGLIHLILLSVLLLAEKAISLQPVPTASTSPDWSKISKRLEEMHEFDQSARKKIAASMRTPRTNQVEDGKDGPEDLWAKQAKDDAANLVQLKEIVSNYGWPRKSVVGEKAARGAFLVLQHADLKYQIEVIPVLREAVAAGEAEKSALALLEDRILVRQRLPQLYGSQVSSTGAYVDIYPVKNGVNLDKLRSEVGLEPICTYLKRFTAQDGKIMYPECAN